MEARRAVKRRVTPSALRKKTYKKAYDKAFKKDDVKEAKEAFKRYLDSLEFQVQGKILLAIKEVFDTARKKFK